MNTAGAYFDTVTLTEVDAACPVSERTTSGYRPAASVGGSCALICVGEVASSESGVLFSVTQAPPSSVGRGELAAVAADARLEPKIEIRPPGATALQIVGRIHHAVRRDLGDVLRRWKSPAESRSSRKPSARTRWCRPNPAPCSGPGRSRGPRRAPPSK